MADSSVLSGGLIELPASCAGDLSGGIPFPCKREAEVAVWGPVEAADGSAVYALVAVCRLHVRGALLQLRGASLAPDLIQAWGLSTFIERQGLIVETLGAPVELLKLRAS